MQKVYIIEGRVTDPEAHGHRAPAGAVEWQFSDGLPGERGSSADYISLEEGLRDHAGCDLVFVPYDPAPEEITIKFTVDPTDLGEVVSNLVGCRPGTPQTNLVRLIQYALYDDHDGPMLEGQFEVIPTV
jgi:hypothetical protein